MLAFPKELKDIHIFHYSYNKVRVRNCVEDSPHPSLSRHDVSDPDGMLVV